MRIKRRVVYREGTRAKFLKQKFQRNTLLQTNTGFLFNCTNLYKRMFMNNKVFKTFTYMQPHINNEHFIASV
jgi:hypothetical protein